MSTILGESDLTEKMLSLLFNVVNTQSQPKINEISKFFESIHKNPDCLLSFEAFVRELSKKSNGNYSDLFEGLKSQNGWGPKTAALFTKTIYHCHNDDYDKSLKLWGDAPRDIDEKDRLYLPVDTVIKRIFEELNFTKLTFSKINDEINRFYNGKSIEVWDDLWFWGFITQKKNNKETILCFNREKYWAMRYSNKSLQEIEVIENKAKKFLSIIKEHS